jgi:hypothetical protein
LIAGFDVQLSMKFGGTRLKIAVLAHCLGGKVARCIVMQKPRYFRKVALAAAPSTGLHFGILAEYILSNHEKGE